MADTLYNRLIGKYVPYKALASRKQISIAEKGKVYTMQLKSAHNSVVYQVDGNIIKDTLSERCDFLLLITCDDECWTEVFVELKGRDISHAIQQLRSTLTSPVFMGSTFKSRHARVITNNHIPANTGQSNIERAKIDFKKLWNSNLKVLRSKQPDIINC